MRFLPFVAWIGLSLNAIADPYCAETTTIYGLGEETPLGFSGADLLNMAVPQDLEVTYAYKPSCTTGRIVVSPRFETARYITSEPVYPPCDDPDGCLEILECEDRVEIDVNVLLSSDDNAFSEGWQATLTSFFNGEEFSDQGTYAGIRLDVQASDLVGNFYDDASSQFSAWEFLGLFEPEGFIGNISSSITRCVGDNDSEDYCYSSWVPGAYFHGSPTGDIEKALSEAKLLMTGRRQK